MGLDRSIAQPRQSSTSSAAKPTSFQPMPAKLPMDQLWRFTMLESSAKLTAISVMAEQT